MYSLLWIFISQYSNMVDFISTGKAEMGSQREVSPKLGARGSLAPPLTPTGVDQI